eukprot:1914010-Pyramimonas_sp.AAC.1
MLRPLVLFFGAKQGPAIVQKLMDWTFGDVRGPSDEEFHSVFMDDCTLSAEAYDNDTDDDVVDRHIEHC